LEKQLQLLAELQEIDIKIEQLRKNIIQKPLKIEKLRAEFKAFERKIEDEAAKQDKLEKERRSCELELKEGEARIVKSKENLMNIKSNKEYKAVLKEIAAIEKANRKIEDGILLCMENIEKAEAGLAEKKREVAGRKDDLEAQYKEIEDDIHQDEQRLASIMESRNQLIGRIDQEPVKKYNQVQERGRTPAIARVKNAVCFGCNMNIPAQLYNELQKFDSIRFCPHCRRIMYYKKEE
jgi:predicted  nucleic acid-binding Zn-ribbon protein